MREGRAQCEDIIVAMKPPPLAALLLGVIPFIAICFTVALWDRIEPMILGLPFNLFWLILWTALTPIFMAFAYRIESRGRR